MSTSPIRSSILVAASLSLSGCVPSDPEASEPTATGDDTDGPEEGDPTGDAPPVCPPEAGPTQHQGDVTADEVWRADDGPHVVTSDLSIRAQVTIEACARVQLGAATTLAIAAGGSLRAEGEPEGGTVIFERLEPDAAWSAIQVDGGTLTLRHARLVGGGDPRNREPFLHGALFVRGREDTTGHDPVLSLRDVVIEGSASAGIRMFERGGFAPDSENLAIAGAAGHPISVDASSAHAIPSGQYTGNADDRVLLTTTRAIGHDLTLTARGVPYLVGSPQEVADLRVMQPGGLATLTIEPGVELQFGRGGALNIEPAVGDFPAQGALVAIGTAAAPIVFTSAAADPAPGDWLGLWFGGVPADGNVVQHAWIEYAGGDGASGTPSCVYPDGLPNEAAIRIAGVPPGQFVTHTTVVASARHGIDRGWRDDLVVDFLPTNDLDDVAACRQSFPQAWDGSCPDPVPCD